MSIKMYLELIVIKKLVLRINIECLLISASMTRVHKFIPKLICINKLVVALQAHTHVPKCATLECSKGINYIVN